MKLNTNWRPILLGAAACLLATGGSVRAQDSAAADEKSADPLPATMMPALPHPLATAPFRDTEYGDVPHYGTPWSPGRGYPHYDYSNERYGHWYRPRAFGLKQDERCLPRPFKPRGYGNLLHRPSTCYRMDYHPFVLVDSANRFGPSYFWRQPDGRCGGDELISIDKDVRWYRFNIHHQLGRIADSLRSMLHPGRYYCD